SPPQHHALSQELIAPIDVRRQPVGIDLHAVVDLRRDSTRSTRDAGTRHHTSLHRTQTKAAIRLQLGSRATVDTLHHIYITDLHGDEVLQLGEVGRDLIGQQLEWREDLQLQIPEREALPRHLVESPVLAHRL